MVWQKRDPHTTDKDWFARHLTNEGFILRASGTARGVFYAAVSKVNSPERVFAWIAEKEWRRTTHGNLFDFDATSEYRGPVHEHAPASVLNALTDTSVDEALEWRFRCRRNLAQKKAMGKLRDGDAVRLDAPERHLGVSKDYFKVKIICEPGQHTLINLYGEGIYFPLRGWRDRVITIVRDDSTGIITPYGATFQEDIYVKRVLAVRKVQPEAVAKHYNMDAFFSPAWKARQEFRNRTLWKGLNAIEKTIEEAATSE